MKVLVPSNLTISTCRVSVKSGSPFQPICLAMDLVELLSPSVGTPLTSSSRVSITFHGYSSDSLLKSLHHLPWVLLQHPFNEYPSPSLGSPLTSSPPVFITFLSYSSDSLPTLPNANLCVTSVYYSIDACASEVSTQLLPRVANLKVLEPPVFLVWLLHSLPENEPYAPATWTCLYPNSSVFTITNILWGACHPLHLLPKCIPVSSIYIIFTLTLQIGSPLSVFSFPTSISREDLCLVLQKVPC